MFSPFLSSFLSWLLHTSPLCFFFFFLTLSGLVSCVTGNVTVSSFFLPYTLVTAAATSLLFLSPSNIFHCISPFFFYHFLLKSHYQSPCSYLSPSLSSFLYLLITLCVSSLVSFPQYHICLAPHFIWEVTKHFLGHLCPRLQQEKHHRHTLSLMLQHFNVH